MAYNLDFNNLMRGDTFRPKRIAINLENITDLCFSIKRRQTDSDYVYHASLENGKLIRHENGDFEILAFPLNFPVGNYYYDIELRYTGNVVTLFLGKMIIKQDVTNAR